MENDKENKGLVVEDRVVVKHLIQNPKRLAISLGDILRYFVRQDMLYSADTIESAIEYIKHMEGKT